MCLSSFACLYICCYPPVYLYICRCACLLVHLAAQNTIICQPLIQTPVYTNSEQYPPEADQTEVDGAGHLEHGVLGHVRLEPLGQATVLPDVRLQTLHPEGPHHEPQLEGPESATEWNAPVLCGEREERRISVCWVCVEIRCIGKGGLW